MLIKTSGVIGRRLYQPENAANAMRAILGLDEDFDKEKEHFWAIGVTTKNTVKYIELCCLGILNACIVHPREVFRTAVHQAAASIILCHNHPSGDTMPSQEDIRITRQIVEAGKIIDIKVLDHVIIGNADGFQSLRESGFVNFDN